MWSSNYEQRNALIRRIAMGFAVIPTILDLPDGRGIYRTAPPIPKGSLALGATRWQTVVAWFAGPPARYSFQRVMMGFCRAVGGNHDCVMGPGQTRTVINFQHLRRQCVPCSAKHCRGICRKRPWALHTFPRCCSRALGYWLGAGPSSSTPLLKSWRQRLAYALQQPVIPPDRG